VRVEELEYSLPPELIAQHPPDERGNSRMLLLDRVTGEFRDEQFAHFPESLSAGDLVVLNNTRVIPARLFGHRVGVHSQPASRATRKEHLTGTVEIFLTRRTGSETWEAMVRPGRKIQISERVRFGNGELEAEVIGRAEEGQRLLRFISRDARSVDEHLAQVGHMPLPPYIDREDEPADRERYQTVFAKEPGAIAAPTAGLHFTPRILERIRERGCEICELTLHVGIGTFKPVQTKILEEHRMHGETYEISTDVAQRIATAKAEGRGIVAVGTTVVRALEDAALRAAESAVKSLPLPGSAEAKIFITPGFRFRVIDALLTNFHLPRSTLLAMVCAFAGRENVLRAYRHAVETRYHFYSYGDCMFIR
jgi:S-adenosylmethionine:tRNA ribosyltransferase-isomerase